MSVVIRYDWDYKKIYRRGKEIPVGPEFYYGDMLGGGYGGHSWGTSILKAKKFDSLEDAIDYSGKFHPYNVQFDFMDASTKEVFKDGRNTGKVRGPEADEGREPEPTTPE